MKFWNKIIISGVFPARPACIALAVFMLFACTGCATIRHPVPLNMVGKVQVDSMPEIRTMTGVANSELSESAVRSLQEENKEDYPLDAEGRRVYPMLCISGGAANGAYGAGLLKGWSAEGSRPKFKAVTGVSTGAIISPLVFLGKDYDGMMEELYTTMSTKDVMKGKGPFQILLGDSFASNKPLERQLKKYVTPDVLKKIAEEHRHGRRLYVGTTYLDAQRFVIWDMGAIACRGDIELFRKVILASAAIPMMFPPVYIHVEGAGKHYDEMHVDGGTMTQVFTLYKILQGQKAYAEKMGIDPSKIKGRYYIIRNGYLDPTYKPVKDSLFAISGQMFDTMINVQGLGDIYRIYTFLQKSGSDYNLAYIPGDFRPEKKEEFDVNMMKKLFNRGYQDALHGYNWYKEPPGLKPGTQETEK